jgi:hypothetical protein
MINPDNFLWERKKPNSLKITEGDELGITLKPETTIIL